MAKHPKGLSKALKLAHSPAVREKAVKTMMEMAQHRRRLGEQFAVSPREFHGPRLLATMKRFHLTVADIPEALFKPLPAKLRHQLLNKRGNGHDKGAGIGIPLEAIPAKKERAAWGTKAPTKKTHPNASMIEKTLELLANPKTSEKVAARLTTALEKMLMG